VAAYANQQACQQHHRPHLGQHGRPHRGRPDERWILLGAKLCAQAHACFWSGRRPRKLKHCVSHTMAASRSLQDQPRSSMSGLKLALRQGRYIQLLSRGPDARTHRKGYVMKETQAFVPYSLPLEGRAICGWTMFDCCHQKRTRPFLPRPTGPSHGADCMSDWCSVLYTATIHITLGSMLEAKAKGVAEEVACLVAEGCHIKPDHHNINACPCADCSCTRVLYRCEVPAPCASFAILMCACLASR
jgi:hypothetical protein